jgi:hypothetical protein
MRSELQSGLRLRLKTPVDKIQEMQAESEMRKKLPEGADGFYSAEYQHIGGRPGTFVGFACRMCKLWAENGHMPACPIEKLESESTPRS